MKVIISIHQNKVIPIMDVGEDTMKQFTADEAKQWINDSILGQASENLVIDFKTGEIEEY